MRGVDIRGESGLSIEAAVVYQSVNVPVPL